ncbi:MAG: hypothetical protein M1823_005997 [Watsoniomyces obsoletus]|nr:MAG: hypothetical protein M1823_005997 [Watsoniomyces obsoletus]
MKYFFLPLVAFLTTASIDVVTAIPITSEESGALRDSQSVAFVPARTPDTPVGLPTPGGISTPEPASTSVTGSKEDEVDWRPLGAWGTVLATFAGTKGIKALSQRHNEKLAVEDDKRELGTISEGTLFQECYEAKLTQWLRQTKQLDSDQSLTWWYQFKGPALYGVDREIHTEKHEEHTKICGEREQATQVVLDQRQKTREAEKRRNSQRKLSRLPRSDPRVVNQRAKGDVMERRPKDDWISYQSAKLPEDFLNKIQSGAFWSEMGDSSKEAFKRGSVAAMANMKTMPAYLSKLKLRAKVGT